MKAKLFLFLLLLMSSSSLFSQYNNYKSPPKNIAEQDAQLDWVVYQPAEALPAEQFFQQHFRELGLDRPSDMQLQQRFEDDLGWTHFRYHQYYRGIRVEGGTYLVHQKDGKVLKANGTILSLPAIDLQPRWYADQILDRAFKDFPAQRYAWENPVSETILQRVRKDPQATHYPQPELVLLDRAFPRESGQYVLAYKLTLFREAPDMDRRTLWYDAHTGELVLNINQMHDTHGEEGMAKTRYHGEQEIMTIKDETGQYVLRDTTRGGGIETYNDNYSDFGELADFTDADNFWDNANIEQDEVATDVHFGTMVTYDFFLDNFGRNSFDDLASPLVSMVHVGDRFNNAYWNGSNMSYGDGDSIRFYPLTAIDVVGHEITHGVTEFSADLIYADESGALNESFSDIFGKTIEATYTPEEFSWILGERMLVDKTNIFRSMEDPHLGEDPKYYRGELWEDGANVHTNSGVQNHWYYLLCEGQQGINEIGYAYDVPAIGMDKAMRIAYRNLTTYLTESSGYKAARRGSLEAAADLFGFCSEEYLAVAEAWTAVGLGAPITANDYEIDFITTQPSACVIDEIEVTVSVLNNSCTTTLPAGSNVVIRYQLDDGAIITEQISINEDLEPSDNLIYQFDQKILNPAIGFHTIKAWINLPNDPYAPNNLIEYTFENRPYQNEDFVGVNTFTTVGICDQVPFRSIFGRFQYAGCDTLFNNPLIPFQISYKDLTIDDQERIPYNIPPGGFAFLGSPIDVIAYGFGKASIEVMYPDDPTGDNNFGYGFMGRIAEVSSGWQERFNGGLMDSTTMAIRPASRSRSAIQRVDDSHQLIITGSNVLDENDDLLVQTSENPRSFFARNSDFHTTLHLCVDLQGLSNPALLFDFQQTKSDTDWFAYEVNPDFATMLAVEIDGTMDTLLFGPPAEAPQTFRLDLSEYDDSHEINLIALALQASIDTLTQTVHLDGDNVIIDNIRLDLGTSTEPLGPQAQTAFAAFPNPSTRGFSLQRIDQKDFDSLQISLTDASGKTLLQRQVDAPISTLEFGKSLAPGIYFLKLVDGEKSGYLKLIKQ